MANHKAESPAKTPAKTPVPLRVPKHGKGKLRSGGSNGGAGGRPPDEFRAFMREMAAKGENGLAEILKTGAKHPLYLGALKHVTEHGYGKPKESIDHTTDGQPISGIAWRLVKPRPGNSVNRLASVLASKSNGNGHNGSG